MTSEKIILEAEKRELLGKKVRALRRVGQVPAVIYGNLDHNYFITLPKKEFTRIFNEVGETSLVYLRLDQKEIPCIIRDHQTNPLNQEHVHVDFLAVNLAEKIEADVPLLFIGQAPAVVDQDGTLIEVKNEVHVEALPTDLVPEIEVDISPLSDFDKILRIKDVVAPKGITILDDSEETIATIEPPKTEEELEAELAEPVSEAEALAKVESETKEGTETPIEEGEEKKKEE